MTLHDFASWHLFFGTVAVLGSMLLEHGRKRGGSLISICVAILLPLILALAVVVAAANRMDLFGIQPTAQNRKNAGIGAMIFLALYAGPLVMIWGR